MYNLDKGEIVEFMNKEKPLLKIHPVKKDMDYWEKKLYPDIVAHFKTLVDIMICSEYREKILTLSEQEQDEIIKKIVREKNKV